MYITKGKKPIRKAYIDSIYMTSQKRQNYGDNTLDLSQKAEMQLWRQSKQHGCGGGDNNFRAVKILYGIIMMNICHYTFVQAQRMYNTKSES